MMIPPGFEHGRIAGRLTVRIGSHVEARGLGSICAAETGFLLARKPDTVRAPDLAFLRASRAPGPDRGYYPGAPDLAVEALSPDDRPGVAEWLEAGARAVWVVDPRSRTVTVHERDLDARVLGEHDVLRGGDLLPGFEMAVADVFA